MMDIFVVVVVLIVVCDASYLSSNSVHVITEEVCTAETFQASCPNNHTILIQKAAYGHMKQGRCISSDSGKFGCQSDVTDVLHRHCSGHKVCEMFVPSPELVETQPCVSHLKLYLDVSYVCQPVLIPTVESCHFMSVYNVTATRGYLSSAVTEETGCGSEISPWQLHAKKGQTINMTLHDFEVAKHAVGSEGFYEDPRLSAVTCKNYGTVQELGSKSPVMICGGQRHQSVILTTTSLRVNISLSTDSLQSTYLIQFQVKGCPDEPENKLTLFERQSHDTASMRCRHQETRWSLACEGNTWIGRRGNCSTVLPPANHKDTQRHDISYGLAIAIIIGAALVVCSLIVMIGIIRYRSRSNYNDYNATYNTQTMLLRRPQAEEYELRCTCPVPQQHAKVTSPSRHVDTGREQQTHTMTIHRSPHIMRHYSLKKTVEAEGNDYEHIWQTPLPDPRMRTLTDPDEKEADITASNNNKINNNKVKSESSQNSGDQNTNNTNSKMATRTTGDSLASSSSSSNGTMSLKENSEKKDKKKPYYVTSKDILLNGPKESYGTLKSSEKTRYAKLTENV